MLARVARLNNELAPFSRVTPAPHRAHNDTRCGFSIVAKVQAPTASTLTHKEVHFKQEVALLTEA